MARVEQAQAEDRPVALVGVEEQAERVGDHAMRAPQAGHDVARRIGALGPAFRRDVIRHAAQRAGRDRLGADEAHARTVKLPKAAERPRERRVVQPSETLLTGPLAGSPCSYYGGSGSVMNSMTATTVRRRHHDDARARCACVAVLAAAAVSLIGVSPAHAQLQAGRPATVPDELLVQFESDASAAEREDARDEAGTRVEEGLREPGLQ